MSLSIGLIALDLDGTLLNHEKEISARNRAEISRVRAKGVHVVVSSGRSLPEAAVFSQRAGCDPLMICEGGTVLGDSTHLTIDTCWPMPREAAIQIVREADAAGLATLCYEEGQVIVPPASGVFFSGANEYQADPRTLHIVEDVAAWLAEGRGRVTKLLTCGDPDAVLALRSRLEGLPGVRLTSSGADNFESLATDAGKGRALCCLRDRLGLAPEQVMAIGDAENDLDMLEAAGVAVAMGNAAASVKAIADYVTATNRQDGVAQAIAAFVP